jgi:hypothetical protein
MPLEGHWQRQQTPLRRLTRRELRTLVTIAAALIAVTVGFALYAVLHTPPAARADCIDVTAASTTGAARFHACGNDALRWCREEAGRQTSVAKAMRPRCSALALSLR